MMNNESTVWIPLDYFGLLKFSGPDAATYLQGQVSCDVNQVSPTESCLGAYCNQQGQVIAYVGMTGLATGPHLHYEFRVNNVHHNPLTVKLPTALPLKKVELNIFRTKRDELQTLLDNETLQLAAKTNDE